MSNEYLEIMKQLANEGGQITLRYRHDSSPAFKADQSIITRSDKEISALAHRLLKKFLSRPGHILIDEEDELRQRYLDQNVLDQSPYIFTIDPVDGTRIYANGMPNFGISIGLLKEGRPWLGVVYFPVLGELYYCDGQESYFVKNAFELNEVKTIIKPVDQLINKHTLFLLMDSFFKHFDWDFKDCHIIIPACAVVDMCWPAVGRGCGSFLRSYLWDFAGSWPIVLSAGLNLRSWESGKVMEKISEDLFFTDKNPWKLKDHYILSSERNFPVLRGKIKLKP